MKGVGGGHILETTEWSDVDSECYMTQSLEICLSDYGSFFKCVEILNIHLS